MDDNGAVVADFLTNVGSLLKTVFWFVIYPPVTIWNSDNIWCSRNSTCPPTAGFFALIAWVLMVVLIVRFIAWSSDTSRRNLVTLLIVAGFYYGLPQLYDGLRELDKRAEQQERQRRINSYR